MKTEAVTNCTIFYSWQSDLSNATNRSLIEKALENAAKAIRLDISIKIDPVIDRDTLGVPGSPNIALTIFRKIEKARVFVCDVTPINSNSSYRATPNPNVLIELGYATALLGSENIIMVLNTAYGGPECLPFDLRMNRVVRYHSAEADQDRTSIRRELEKKFEENLRIVLDSDNKTLIKQHEAQATRQLLSQEINRNVRCLSDIYNRVRTEEIKYRETFRTDGAGGWSSEGNPLAVLFDFYPATLSTIVWETQTHNIPSALNPDEIKALFDFYGNIQEVISLQENFRQFLSGTSSDSSIRLVVAGKMLEDVMESFRRILENYPKVL